MQEKKAAVNAAIEKYLACFEKVLYEDDKTFLVNMRKKNIPEEEIEKYRYWEWTQGVGLFGVWKLFRETKDRRYLDILTAYYERQLKIGLPGKNVNTVAPLLPMAYVGEYLGEERYLSVCREWAEWILRGFPRTAEGGLQHITSDSVNEGELWDDTLFMTVLFLTAMGRIDRNPAYQREAEYQFLLHTKYLADRKTGLWYHGWSFPRGDHFAGAFWGRGNCWVTAAIPEFLSMADCTPSVRDFLVSAWRRQVESLLCLQAENGMWHTLLDDPDSYLEASATCGFGYGILRGGWLRLRSGADALSFGPGFGEHEFRGHYSPAFAGKIGEELGKRGLHVSVLGCYINPVHPDEAARRREVDRFIERLRYAKDIGADMVGTETGRFSPDMAVTALTQSKECWRVLLGSFSRIVREAETLGVTVGVEGVFDHTLSTPERMARFLRDLASPAVRVILDFANLVPPDALSAEAQRSLAERAFSLYGERIAVLHLKDCVFENGVQRCVRPGTGVVRWEEPMRLIAREKPELTGLLEESSPARYAQDCAFFAEKYEEAANG